jgi:hypothetical protein
VQPIGRPFPGTGNEKPRISPDAVSKPDHSGIIAIVARGAVISPGQA